jgi:predicted regulator of Ras-like GTPase activity (Roadblock/LC7/MglB family)
VDAAQALADLTEISSQLKSAVLVGADGSILASTFSDSGRAEGLAGAARELLAAAGELGSQPLVQLEASLRDGSVFVVRDGERLIAATTTPEPTVGLVFYDLKSCLRAAAGEEKPKPKAKRAAKKEEEPADA